MWKDNRYDVTILVNGLPKEMLYFTYDEFQKFLSVEKDIKFRCAW